MLSLVLTLLSMAHINQATGPYIKACEGTMRHGKAGIKEWLSGELGYSDDDAEIDPYGPRPFTCKGKGKDRAGNPWPDRHGVITAGCTTDKATCPKYKSGRIFTAGHPVTVTKSGNKCTYSKKCPDAAMSDYEDYMMYEEAWDNLETAKDTFRMAERLWEAERAQRDRSGWRGHGWN
jgi:hypothetical protein